MLRHARKMSNPRQKEVLTKNLAMLKDQVKLIDAAMDKRVPNRFHDDQQAPAVHLDRWMKENKESVDKPKEPVGNSVFLVKIVLEGLSSGPMTEKDLRGRVSDTCKFMGVRSTSRGTITGLAIDISTVCGVLQCLGLIEPVTIAPTASCNQRPQSALQHFREEICERSMSKNAGVAPGEEAGAVPASSGTGNGNGGGGGVMNGEEDDEGMSTTVATKGGQSSTQDLVEKALQGLSLQDFDAILSKELELLAAECVGQEREASSLSSSSPSSAALTVSESSPSRLGLELVRGITEENRALLASFYKEARSNFHRMELKSREKETKKVAKKAQATKQAAATTSAGAGGGVLHGPFRASGSTSISGGGEGMGCIRAAGCR